MNKAGKKDNEESITVLTVGEFLGTDKDVIVPKKIKVTVYKPNGDKR